MLRKYILRSFLCRIWDDVRIYLSSTSTKRKVCPYYS